MSQEHSWHCRNCGYTLNHQMNDACERCGWPADLQVDPVTSEYRPEQFPFKTPTIPWTGIPILALKNIMAALPTPKIEGERRGDVYVAHGTNALRKAVFVSVKIAHPDSTLGHYFTYILESL